MKIFFIISLSVTLLFIPFLTNSFAQLEKQDPIYLLLQLEIRNSSGELLGFIESDRTTIFDYHTLSDFLDKNEQFLNKQDFVINGQNIEVFTAVGSKIHDSQTVYSHSVIADSKGIVAFANHDGFLINPGDQTISTWTIIRNLS